MTRVIMIHGNGAGSKNEAAGGNGHSYWFPATRAALEAAGVECLTPDFPEPAKARASIWLPYIEAKLKADSSDVIVGHSSGALAAMRYAETRQLGGLVLISAYETDLGVESERATGYFDKPWNWEAIRLNAAWIGQFASAEDPWIPIKEARHIGHALTADYRELPGEGHFIGIADQPKTEFPELVDMILRKMIG